MRVSRVEKWFLGRFPNPTPIQGLADPSIRAGRNVLLVSPTGTGKTLAAFRSILSQLDCDWADGCLEPGIQALYVSPLRALTYDLEKNLQGPLGEIYPDTCPIRIGLRTGDTPANERQRQRDTPPHLLLTTPESLCVLLSQRAWLPALAQVRWVVIDEIHALAESKRGSHLSLSLERLEHVRSRRVSSPAPTPLQRIGLSATVSPADAVAAFLGGVGRPVEILQPETDKKVRLDVYTPLKSHPYPAAGFSGHRLLGELADLIRQHRTTLVFTNTRSGAEGTSYGLRRILPDLQDQIECHHGSLDRDVRLDIEDRLKQGRLRAVVCSTSLEMGIDVGHIDLVVMLSTPKGVSRALQRAGRSGHRIDAVSRGLMMATNIGDLVECCATARLARLGNLDPIRIPTQPLDVLAQHLVGMGCLGPWSKEEALSVIRRAMPYQQLSDSDFECVLDYLAGGGASLRRQYTDVFGRIHLEAAQFESRAGSPRQDFLQNIGTIPSDGVIQVRHHRKLLGTVEEGFLRALNPGDVFMLGGHPLRIQRMDGMECRVIPAPDAVPTLPRWGNSRFPLSNRVATEIRAFRQDLSEHLIRQTPTRDIVEWITERLGCGTSDAVILHRVHETQHAVSAIPTDDSLLVECYAECAAPSAPPAPPVARRHYFFHALIGRAANETLCRVIGRRMGKGWVGNPVVTPDDYGFVVTVPPDCVLTEDDIRGILSPDGFEEELQEVLSRSELLKYHFRIAAQTGLMVYRNYFGQQKSVRKLQWSAEVLFNVLIQHEPDHVLLREARRDAIHTFLDVPAALGFLQSLRHRSTRVRLHPVDRVPPLSFAMYASRLKETLRVEDPRETMERLYHLWWEQLNPGSPSMEIRPPNDA